MANAQVNAPFQLANWASINEALQQTQYSVYNLSLQNLFAGKVPAQTGVTYDAFTDTSKTNTQLTTAQVDAINRVLKVGETTTTTTKLGPTMVDWKGNVGGQIHSQAIAVDSQGTVHLVFGSETYNSSYWNLGYVTITKDGTASSTTWLTTSTTAVGGESPAIAIDSNNTAHIVFHSAIYNASSTNIAYMTVTASGTVSGITWLTNSTTAQSQFPAIAIDSNNTAHIVFHSAIYNANYNNIAYLTVTSSGTVSAITWLTTSTTATSQFPAIALDSSNTAHIVFHSEIYSASYWNIAYLTVTSSGTVSAITWLTTSTTVNSMNPIVAVDSSNTAHIVFNSWLYNANAYNIAYMTVTASGTVSAITWLTTSTTAVMSSTPIIAIDSNAISHIIFSSQLYSDVSDGNNTYNIAYVTVTSGGTVSPLQWLTNIGTHPQYGLNMNSFALGFNAAIGGVQIVWGVQETAFNVVFSTVIGNSVQSYGVTNTPNTSSLFVSTDTILSSPISAATLWLNRTPVTTTTLSAAVPSGTTALPLTNSTGFGAGDTVEIITGTTYDRGLVSVVSGSTITLTNGLINAFPSGGTVNRVDFLPDISIVSAGASDVFNVMAWQQTTVSSGTVLEDTYTYTTNMPGEQVALEINCSRVNTNTHPLCNGYGLGLGVG